jgi:Asp-tRNAAsn/Glu-tRNAGln amidotransferase A subunit and related amidases
MRTDELRYLTIAEAAELIGGKKLSPVELTEACLARIDSLDDKVQAWVTVVGDAALEAAREAEQEIAAGKYRGPLHGIPYAVKDIIYTAGIRTTGGSKVDPEFVPAANAAIIDQLAAAGAILLGKTTTTEFAFWGGAPATRNPWNLEHTPGGSSAGSAAAVAASMALFSLGTQTIGSLLRPAAYNGLTCLKATYGRVSRYGVIPAAWSLDHVGALTTTVEDTALVLEAIAGHDPRDPASLPGMVPRYSHCLDSEISGTVIGIPSAFFQAEEPSITLTMEEAGKVLGDLGVRVRPIDLPVCWDEAAASLTVVMRAEAAAYHYDKFVAAPEKFGPYIREQLRMGSLIPAVDYLRAQRIRTLFREEMLKLFNTVDVIVTPTTPTVAPLGFNTGSPAFNGPFTNAGLPAITVPIGFDAPTGLPIGMQLAGPPLAEELLLALAHNFQKSTDWHDQRPKL